MKNAATESRMKKRRRKLTYKTIIRGREHGSDHPTCN
jgi:hypothetical protein